MLSVEELAVGEARIVPSRAIVTVVTMDATWTLADLRRELERFEAEARRAGLKETTVRTYADRSGIFLRWLAGDCQFQGSNP